MHPFLFIAITSAIKETIEVSDLKKMTNILDQCGFTLALVTAIFFENALPQVPCLSQHQCNII